MTKLRSFSKLSGGCSTCSVYQNSVIYSNYCQLTCYWKQQLCH